LKYQGRKFMDLDIDLGKELGATGEPAPQRLTLYIPSKDSLGNELDDHENWVQGAQELHKFGRETKQGEVKFEFDGWLWTIDNYDSPEKG
jgi:hypothetical protein